MTEEKSEYIRRMADDGAGNLASDSQIQDNISEAMALLGNVTTDPDDIPVGASIRASGLFTDSADALEYLELGGLVATSGGDNIPLPFVHFLYYYDDDLQEEVYQIYISDESEEV